MVADAGVQNADSEEDCEYQEDAGQEDGSDRMKTGCHRPSLFLYRDIT